MSISRKYPLLLLVATVGTALAIYLAMHQVLRTAYEKEILKGGSRLADALAGVSAEALADADDEELGLIVASLVRDTANVLDARIVDATGTVRASLAPGGVGTAVPRFMWDPDEPSYFADHGLNAYHLRSDIWHDEPLIDSHAKPTRKYVGAFVLTLSRTPLDAALAQASKRAMLFASGVALVMFIFGLVFIAREMGPLRLMTLAFAQGARGNFTGRVELERNDELGELAASFNHMLERIELFSRYNDKTIIERLAADRSLARPGGSLREVSVLFGDMRGYTAMSNRRTADQVVRIVNTYFHLYIECIAFWGGMVDKTMGDAIMAVFERPEAEATGDQMRRGLLALCYMKAASRVLNHFLYTRKAAGEDLDVEAREFGFAMASGRAIIGNIGSDRHMDYTVCGRVVNLAARLEGLTKNGEVIIDSFSLVGTGEIVRSEELSAVQPKGFTVAEMVTPHRVVSMSDEEALKLRVFLKRIFTYNFVRQMLMPAHLTLGEEQPWCTEAEKLLLRIIAETPTVDFFVRVDPETGQTLDTVQAV